MTALELEPGSFSSQPRAPFPARNAVLLWRTRVWKARGGSCAQGWLRWAGGFHPWRQAGPWGSEGSKVRVQEEGVCTQMERADKVPEGSLFSQIRYYVLMASCSFFTATLTSAKASYVVLLLAHTLCYLLDHKVHEGKAQISPDLSWHTADHSRGVNEPMDLSVLAPHWNDLFPCL